MSSLQTSAVCYKSSQHTLPRLKSAVLLLLLMVLVPSLLPAVTGVVRDSTGKAIAGAFISDKRRVVYSSEDGSFSISTAADSLYVSRIGYQPLALNLASFRSPVILLASDIVMPTVRVKALEYKPIIPSLQSGVIHPDTNAKAGSASELLLESTSFTSSDIQLSGERQTLSLLGSISRHALVMLDGVVLNPAGEAFDFSKLPLGQISEIEIIKGNSSVYGGSAAIGGIIHIHSKSLLSNKTPELQLSSSLGAFDMFRQSYAAAFSRNHYAINAEYSHQTARNDFAYDTPGFWNTTPVLHRTHNRKTSDSFFGKGSVFNASSRVDYNLNAGSFVRQLPGPINFLELYDSSQMTGAYYQQNLRASTTRSKLSSELLLWQSSDQSTYQNLHSTIPYARSHYRQKQVNTGVKAGTAMNLDLAKLGLNAEYSNIDYRFENLLAAGDTEGNRHTTALACSAQRSFYPHYMEYSILAAARADYSDDRLHPTWRLENELRLPFAGELKCGGYAGTAFSQPSLFDMYWIGDSETHGNPDLESETSFGYSLYAELGYQNLKLRLAYYRNLVQNLIQWRQYYLNGLSWKPFNVGKADLQNYEAEAAYNLGKYLALSGNLTLTHARDHSRNADGSSSPTYDKALVYTPGLKATSRLSFSNKLRGASISYSYTGEQYSTPDNLIEPLPAFDNVNADLFWRHDLPFCTIQLDLKAYNLLNRCYEIYAYTPQPGFNWQTGLTLSTKGFVSQN